LVNPMNTTPLLIKSFFPPKGAKEGGGSADSSTGTTAKPDTKGGKQEKKSAEVGDTKDTGDDKAFQKQEQALISANQKNGYEGVMEEIESYAPYEDMGSTTVRVSVPLGSGGSVEPQAEASKLISMGAGGAKEDPFEALDFFG